MKTIGKSRLEGIDWVQHQLETSSRPRAEHTYFAMAAEGIIVESKGDVSVTRIVTNEDVHTLAKAEEIRRLNVRTNRNSQRMTRRHSPPTSQRKKSRVVHLHQGNSIDCAEDDIYK